MKHLIVCCDGTWNNPEQEENGVPAPTNVFKLYNALAEASQGNEQLKYYHPGVGGGGRSGLVHCRRRIRGRDQSAYLQRLSLAGRKLHRRGSDLPVRFQPRRVHRPQSGRFPGQRVAQPAQCRFQRELGTRSYRL